MNERERGVMKKGERKKGERKKEIGGEDRLKIGVIESRRKG